MSKQIRQVTQINGVPILVDDNNWVKSAGSIQAVLSLPKIPGFPDYRWDADEAQAYSTQYSGSIKRLSYSKIDFSTEVGYKLWVDGRAATLPPDLINNMIARNGKTKQELRPSHNAEVIVFKDQKIFGHFKNQSEAEVKINRPGLYRVYGLLSSFQVSLQVKMASTEPLVGHFYGIDE